MMARTADLSGSPEDFDVARLFRFLGYLDASPAEARYRAAMLEAASMMGRLFRLPAPDAPGLCFLGATVDPAKLGEAGFGVPPGSVAGAGLSWMRAFETCLGEAIEYLGQAGAQHIGWENDTARNRQSAVDLGLMNFVSAVLDHCDVPATRSIGWATAHRLVDRMMVAVPVDLCVRRPIIERDFTPPLKLSTGCAAGRTVASASLHALLELIERDAVALWWRGGALGRPLPAGGKAEALTTEYLGRLRQEDHRRITWLLDITSDLGIPVVAAISTNHSGGEFSYGTACRPTVEGAVIAAVTELCQMELGQRLAAAKLAQRGQMALTRGDRLHLQRAELVNPAHCAMLHPAVGESHIWDAPEGVSDAEMLRCVAEWLHEKQIVSYAIELTRPEIEVPVVRVMTPGLQLDPCGITTKRLREMIRRTGGGDLHSGGVALY